MNTRAGSLTGIAIILILLATLVFVIGYVVGRKSYNTSEMYRQAELVGMTEQKLLNAKTESDRDFYREWLQNLEDRGYMWSDDQLLDWHRWDIPIPSNSTKGAPDDRQ